MISCMSIQTLLHKSKNFPPPTQHALKLISNFVNCCKILLGYIVEAMGSDIFKSIVQMRDNSRFTLLHLFVTYNKFIEEDYAVLKQHWDIHTLNDDGANAATLAFEHNDWEWWVPLECNGSAIQSDQNSKAHMSLFVEKLLQGDIPDMTLELFDKNYLQKMLYPVGSCLIEYLPNQNIKNRIAEVIDKLVHAGAVPRVKASPS